MKDKIKVFLGSGFCLGLLPLLPGSFGALVGLVWHISSAIIFDSPCLIRISCLVGVLVFSAIHYWLTSWAQRYWGEADPKNFVLDEIVGYLCVPVFMLSGFYSWWHYLVAFVVFRIFDAIKLPGARYVDKNIHNAHGVLFDDVISALYTALVMSLFSVW